MLPPGRLLTNLMPDWRGRPPRVRPTLCLCVYHPPPTHQHTPFRPVSHASYNPSYMQALFPPVPPVSNQQQLYQTPASAGLFTPTPHHIQPSYTRPSPPSGTNRVVSATPTALMYGGGMTGSQTGVNLNIMASNKPKRLELLSYQNIKKFLSEFTH